MKNIKNIISVLKIDTISKFNLLNIKSLVNYSNLNLRLNLNLNDIKFFSNYYYISKVVFFWFNSKLSIIKSFREFQLNHRKKNTVMVTFGIKVSKKFLIEKNLWYLLNIVKSVSKTIDNNFKFNSNFLFFNYYFNNINYLLGLKEFNEFYVWRNNLNIFLHFKKESFLLKNIVKFYAKLFN